MSEQIHPHRVGGISLPPPVLGPAHSLLLPFLGTFGNLAKHFYLKDLKRLGENRTDVKSLNGCSVVTR